MHTKTIFLSIILLNILVGSLVVNTVNSSPELWSQIYGKASYETAYALVETSDGSYVLVGSSEEGVGFYSTVWLVKTDLQGSVEWNKTYSNDDQNGARALVETTDSGYVLAGYSGSSLNNRTKRFWLIKTDAEGNIEWNQLYDKGIAYSLVISSDGGFALAGDNRLVKTDTLGNQEWSKTYSGGEIRSLIATSDGGYALAGFGGMNEWGYYSDFWLIKTDALGHVEWNRTYGRINEEWTRIYGDVYDLAHSLVETSDGGFAVAGKTGPDVFAAAHGWLVKTDPQGNMEWNQTYNNGSIFSLAKTSDNGFALTGSTRSYGATYDDFWLIKTDCNGNAQWNQTYGGEKSETAYCLVETADGGYVVAGYTNSFGTENSDFWLIKTDAQGIPEFSSWIVLQLFGTIMLVVIVYGKKLHKTQNSKAKTEKMPDCFK